MYINIDAINQCRSKSNSNYLTLMTDILNVTDLLLFLFIEQKMEENAGLFLLERKVNTQHAAYIPTLQKLYKYNTSNGISIFKGCSRFLQSIINFGQGMEKTQLSTRKPSFCYGFTSLPNSLILNFLRFTVNSYMEIIVI